MVRRVTLARAFLSIQAQDFIEEGKQKGKKHNVRKFLSIQAQDFIEESTRKPEDAWSRIFLSIQAQDFIEDSAGCLPTALSGGDS